MKSVQFYLIILSIYSKILLIYLQTWIWQPIGLIVFVYFIFIFQFYLQKNLLSIDWLRPFSDLCQISNQIDRFFQVSIFWFWWKWDIFVCVYLFICLVFIICFVHNLRACFANSSNNSSRSLFFGIFPTNNRWLLNDIVTPIFLPLRIS